MTSLTLQLPDQLAQRLQPAAPWLSAILELTLLGCRTQAAATAAEVIQFLLGAPTPSNLLAFHVSSAAQNRLQRLLTLNEAGLLAEIEQQELEELEQIEHILVMLKAQTAKSNA